MPRPPRVTISNMALGPGGPVLEAQYNPTQAKETIEANFTKLVVPGLSHPIHQYVATGAHQVSLDFTFDSLSGAADIMEARRYLLAMLYPRRGATSVLTGAPPEALIIWPGWISLRCKLGKIDINHLLFSQAGPPSWFVASLSLDEARDTRLYSEDVFQFGTQRAEGV